MGELYNKKTKKKKMGLDIRVYSNVKQTQDAEIADFTAYVLDEDWSHKIKNLQNGAWYVGDVSFRGISYPYSCHNIFRENLIKLIDRNDLLGAGGKIIWDKLTLELPFIDLIEFADNEGCLDWEVSAKLYLEFQEYDSKAQIEMDEYNYRNYKIWTETFLKGKENNSVVVFS